MISAVKTNAEEEIAPSGGARNRRPGFAMVMALIAVAALSSLALRMSETSAVGAALAKNSAEKAQARLAAEGALARGAAALLLLETDTHAAGADPIANRLRRGEVVDLSSNGLAITLRATEAAGLLDINQAPATLIDGALAAVETSAEAIKPLRDAMLDWRDADSDPRLLGGEAPLYQIEGRPPPANRAFHHLSELTLIRTATPQQAQALARLTNVTTVWNGAPTVNPVFASQTVIEALPGLDEAQAARLLAERSRLFEKTDDARGPLDAATIAERLIAHAPPAARPFLSTRLSGVWLVEAQARKASGATAVLRRALRITDPRAVGGPIFWIDSVAPTPPPLNLRSVDP